MRREDAGRFLLLRFLLWHDSPTDGRAAHLIRRWNGLSPEGKALLDLEWDHLLGTHPAPVRQEDNGVAPVEPTE